MNAWQLPLRLLVFAVVTTLTLGLVSGGLGGSVEAWSSSFGAHVVLGMLLASIVRGQRGSLRWIFATQFTLVIAVLVANTAIELFFFSDTSVASAGSFLALGTLASAGYVVLACLLFFPRAERAVVFDTPEVGEPEAVGRLRSHLGTRSAASWTWRVMGGALSYIVVYLLVGAIAFRYTGPYYMDPSYGLELVVPSLGTIVMVQVARSLVFVLALWPIVAGADLTRLRASALGGAALFVLGGLFPLLLNVDWPTALRFYHTVEIFFQNMPAGFVICWLLWSEHAPNRSERLESLPAQLQASEAL